MKWCITKHVGYGLLLSVCSSTSTFGADVYRSERADGSISYASQPYDQSYRLYLSDDTERLPVSTSAESISSSISKNSTSRKSLEELIDQLAKKHSVDASLVRAIIDVESSFKPTAKSPKGATGLMQLMPATAAHYGVRNLTDPAQNIEAGIRYLKDLLTLHNGNIALALASYNAGEHAVVRHGRRIPPYRETMLYVPAVLSRMQAGSNLNSR